MNTTNLILLGASGTAAIALALAGLNRLHPLTRLRNLVRRMLGIAAFEKLTLSKLRSYRAAMDYWMRDTGSDIHEVRSDVTSLDEDVQRRNTALSADRTRNNRVRIEVEELGILLRSYTDALGPMWTTAQGHKMPLRLLSTGHLHNILKGGFTKSPSVIGFINSELRRRSVDADYRADEAKGKPSPTRDQMRDIRPDADLTRIQNDLVRESWADPRLPMTYTPEVACRVVRVLPQWAQDIIAELVQMGGGRLKLAERKRIKQQLPIWAQQTISDLSQPR